jgi:hypothetical protein
VNASIVPSILGDEYFPYTVWPIYVESEFFEAPRRFSRQLETYKQAGRVVAAPSKNAITSFLL